MDLHLHSTRSRHTSKQHQSRLTQDQVWLLETSFNNNQRLQTEKKLELANRLGLSTRRVAIWYQNRRARQKSHTIELDYKTIQLELDKVLAEKKRLEKEVGMLKHQLDEAQQMLLLAANPSATPLPSVSVSCDEDHVSSDLSGNMILSCKDAKLLPMEELYACLIEPEGQLEISGSQQCPCSFCNTSSRTQMSM